MHNILNLISSEGFEFKKVAMTNGGEYAGPCPFCGGKDRFVIWPEYKGGRWWCRRCEKTGDAIQYIRDRKGLSFKEACLEIGILKVGYAEQNRRKKTKQTFRPRAYELPPTLWMQKASIILENAKNNLWLNTGQIGRDVLFQKGINEQTIKSADIGFMPNTLYRDRRSWGLIQVFWNNGKPKPLWIPSGVIIPLTLLLKQDGRGENQKQVIRLRVRQSDPGTGPPYAAVSGSSMQPLILGTDKKIFTIVESELDALLIWQEAADITGVIAMGSANMKPDVETHKLLLNADKILNALDHDPAGTHYAWHFWSKTYGQKCIRWPVPVGKDPSEAWQKGLNIRAWIEAGIE